MSVAIQAVTAMIIGGAAGYVASRVAALILFRRKDR